MKIETNPNGRTATVTIEDGDELAPYTVYRGATETFRDVAIRDRELFGHVLKAALAAGSPLDFAFDDLGDLQRRRES